MQHLSFADRATAVLEDENLDGSESGASDSKCEDDSESLADDAAGSLSGSVRMILSHWQVIGSVRMIPNHWQVIGSVRVIPSLWRVVGSAIANNRMLPPLLGPSLHLV